MLIKISLLGNFSVLTESMELASVIRTEHQKRESYWSWLVGDVLGLIEERLLGPLWNLGLTSQEDLNVLVTYQPLSMKHDVILYLHQRSDGQKITLRSNYHLGVFYQEYDERGRMRFQSFLGEFDQQMIYPIEKGILYLRFVWNLEIYQLMFLEDQPQPERYYVPDIATNPLLGQRVRRFNSTHIFTDQGNLYDMATQTQTNLPMGICRGMDDRFLYLEDGSNLLVINLWTRQTVRHALMFPDSLLIIDQSLLRPRLGLLHSLWLPQLSQELTFLRKYDQVFYYRRNGRIFLVGSIGTKIKRQNYLQTFTFYQ